MPLRSSFFRIRVNFLGLAALVFLLLIWEACARLTRLSELYFPPISLVLLTLVQLVFSGELVSQALITLFRFATGYALSATIAVTLGIILGYFRLAYSLFEGVIEFLRPMPSVAIIPVAILFLGIGDPMVVAVTVYACTWPILINTIDGVRNIDRTLIDTGRTFGLGRWKILKTIALPAASPYIFTGLRISVAIGLILVTTCEMVVGGSGLGFFILDEERSLKTSNMYAGIILVAILGYALNRLFSVLERKAMRWHRGMRAQGFV
ncbi:MAG: ABC transporter permease [Deltaproteobacteria bacterium]|nr:ABC transporter permease [Deltaproteobacteria bacterium]